MKPRQGFEVRVIAGATVLALLLQPSAFAQRDPVVASSATQLSVEQFPDSPGTVQSASNRALAMNTNAPQAGGSADSETAQPQQSDPANAPARQDPPLPAPSASSPSGTSATQSQPQEQPREQTSHEPLGTAAAESVQTTGVAASRPAGAAVAPAKQRRVRSILIKVGALAAAGVAIGTTMALSQGSPSKPPGTH
jgi:hypothetical protein